MTKKGGKIANCLKTNVFWISCFGVKKTKLPSLLKQYFNFHMSRINCLSAFVLSIIQSRTISLPQIAGCMLAENINTNYRRLQRFLKDICFIPSKLAYLIATIIDLNKKEKWRLILDRTNWKLGKVHINILFLAVCKQKLAIPLFFTFLCDKKRGNSSQQDRIDLIKRFTKTFGKKCIGLILGDREFIGAIWMNHLIKEGLPFCVRLKEGWQKVSLPSGQMVEVKKCFRGLKKGQIQSLGLRQLGDDKNAVMCYITGLRNEQGEWVIVAHSEGLDNPCEIYRQRWQIEPMFRAMKTGGFNLEATHVIDPKRLECLLSIVAITYALCYRMGEIITQKIPPKPKNHGYWPKSIFRYGLDKIRQSLASLFAKPTYFYDLIRQIFTDFRLSQKKFVM
jgi:hypothetical protein